MQKSVKTTFNFNSFDIAFEGDRVFEGDREFEGDRVFEGDREFEGDRVFEGDRPPPQRIKTSPKNHLKFSDYNNLMRTMSISI
jgi:hypothetical protein